MSKPRMSGKQCRPESESESDASVLGVGLDCLLRSCLVCPNAVIYAVVKTFVQIW